VKRILDDPANGARTTMNMTPMIDVVFQLIVVFLCSMKFKTLDQKVEATLPRDRSVESDAIAVPDHHPVLAVRLQCRGPGDPTRVVVAGNRLGEVDEGDPLWTRLEAFARAVLARSPALVGEIDASPEVEHGAVIRALDGLTAAGLTSVRFRGTRAR
jgi:biopolymer transport protein ExbD